MNFSEFCDNNQNIENFEKKYQKNSKNTTKNVNFESKMQNFDNDELKNDIQNKLNKYQNLSQSELTAELFKEATKQKQNGNLDAKKLDEIKEQLLPLLNEQEKQKLLSLVDMLK